MYVGQSQYILNKMAGSRLCHFYKDVEEVILARDREFGREGGISYLLPYQVIPEVMSGYGCSGA